MRAGFTALLGRPNVGKSTLLNALAGEDVSIVTPKPETTRERITAVVTREDAQVVFVDTPGLHRPHGELGAYMNREAAAGASDADVVVHVADASDGAAGVGRDAVVREHLAAVTGPVILALNKVDRVRAKGDMLPLIEAYAKQREYAAVVPIAAAHGDGVARLLDECAGRVPEGDAMFPPDALTDRPERYLVAERIREAVILETGAEIPYVAAVEIERFEEKNPTLVIGATIHVERPGQKKIVVGTRGERIKAIGSRARAAVESLLGRHVFLELWVKVTPDWTRSQEALARLGYAARAKRQA